MKNILTKKNNVIRFPAEWEPQSFIQLTFPHAETDWGYMLEEALDCFVSIATEVVKSQKLLVVGADIELAKTSLSHLPQDKIEYHLVVNNDTWARDHGAISVFKNGKPQILDFAFNGWGLKFPSNLDNQISKKLFDKNVFPKNVKYRDRRSFILEGGSVESDGEGTILTTANCLLSINRNNMKKSAVERRLRKYLGAERVLWLHYGFLEGDDTDSHIDTLARFCSVDTIAYVKCENTSDVHYQELKKMEDELKLFRQKDSNKAYKLVALPMADPVYDIDGKRLPATYANFLIMNGAVLVPTYRSVKKDNEALSILTKVFPDREVIGVDCVALIEQHGSLHCVTMQYPQF